MFQLCVLGHSLVPANLTIDDSTVNLEILRYPGATIPTITANLNDINFWTRNYDGLILILGGNDLAQHSVDHVFDQLCNLARRLKPTTNFLTICTVEYRLYPRHNRFGVDQQTYRRKVVTINRKIRRFTKAINARFVDLGRREFTINHVSDGVHFSPLGQTYLCRLINRVVAAYLRS